MTTIQDRAIQLLEYRLTLGMNIMEGRGLYYPTDTAIAADGRMYVANRSLENVTRGVRVTIYDIRRGGLVHELREARDDRRLLNLQRQLARLKLLIIDEMGFVPLSTTGAELLFEVFSQRYEGGSIMVTTNIPSTSGPRSSARSA